MELLWGQRTLIAECHQLLDLLDLRRACLRGGREERLRQHREVCRVQDRLDEGKWVVRGCTGVDFDIEPNVVLGMVLGVLLHDAARENERVAGLAYLCGQIRVLGGVKKNRSTDVRANEEGGLVPHSVRTIAHEV